ncbi:TspO/MBR family protein [Novosphingobium sp. MBES04]|uniref:TspO/MBR family protein n=1 Tax=Novosphingobium sp. MBES04 TaxID=1206458 RepID=UPI00057E41AB|nr:TspO/MBR family protein [Novosphingobium sp. MBES04]GAM07393.1 TspO and MBR like proteins [Novosphingobium sp. MBES04]
MNLLASSGQLRASFLRWSLVCVPALVLCGFLSGALAQSGPQNVWFAALAKPAVYPPPAAFGIVWTILYAMMGFALALILAARGAAGRGLACGIFALQFLVNLAWSPVFFGMHRITGALVVIAVLDVLVLVTIALFWRIRVKAGLLLVPYLAWILFATYLNYAFLQINRDLDGKAPSGAEIRYEI